MCEILHSSVENCMQKFPTRKGQTNKQWWNRDCTLAKRRNGLFYYIWKESGRPSSGTIYETYKGAKRQYRKTCKKAMDNIITRPYETLDHLHKSKNSKQFWNVIRKSKMCTSNSNAITNTDLSNHFREKLSSSVGTTEYIRNAEKLVSEKYDQLSSVSFGDSLVSESRVKRYIKQLKGGTAAGHDGITPEHVKYALKTKLPLYISDLLSTCLKYGLVPDSFRIGVLVPILKKRSLDPSVAKNYRPITISAVFSKILEYYILDRCSNHQYNEFQFGFVSGRGTSMATSFVHDVSEYCRSVGSSVFLCSLDVEGAYDGIPHSILFHCAGSVLPDDCWRILYNWYTCLCVSIKWNNMLGQRIDVSKGLRQGGLTSTMLFNAFYQQLVDKLSVCNSGIIINNHKYNVFCYADDLLLASTTVTGLQSMIDMAVAHLAERGLKFNPSKTTCMTYGGNPFRTDPS